MKTVFGLFENYSDASEAVSALLEAGVDFEDLNAIVSEDTVKNNMDMNYERRARAVSDEGDGHVRGLDRLVGGQQPVPVLNVGPVYAGGDEATLLARSAADQSGDERGFVEVMSEVSVAEDAARSYQTGVIDGGVLLWVHAEDDRAPDAINLMQKYNAKAIDHYGD